MKNALIIGASGGIGQAIASELTLSGVAVTGVSRRENGLDITDEQSIEAHLDALSGPFDLILVATGALEINGVPPEKTLRSLGSDAMLDQFKLNAIGPALVLKHALRLISRDQRAVIAVLSARVGSIGDNNLGGWYSYRASKAALNQLVRTAAIELARTHKQAICTALHPGTVATPFTAKYLGRHPAVSPSQAARNLIAVIEDLNPDDTGRFFDWAGKSVPW